MRLLVMAGFLGSGKTTLLVRVARALVAAGQRLAIIENEVGAVGVDDRILAAEGLPVRELYSGCVCCTLRTDLITALLALEREVAPDIVILEPSGVAGPGAVRQALLGYGGDLDSLTVLVLADVPRFAVLTGPLAPLLQSSLAAADLAALTKTDAADAAHVQAACRHLQELRPGLPVAVLSAETGQGLDAFLDELCRRLTEPLPRRAANANAAVPVSAPTAPRSAAAAAAAEAAWSFAADHSTAAIADVVGDLVAAIGKAAAADGAKVYGHIKAVVEIPAGGYAAFSLTGAESQPRRRGALTAASTRSAAIRVNAILCGIDRPTLQQLVDTALTRATDALGRPSASAAT